MAEGQIFKIHSDFYYVHIDGNLIECKLREVLKKQGLKPVVGDFVRVESNAIFQILPRKNFIARPSAANIDQVIIVSALKNPDLNLIQLNRYTAFAEYYGLEPILCFNKDDLVNNEKLSTLVKSIYEPLNYRILFTSAVKKYGLKDFMDILENKSSVLCGSSGVGKSSLVNAVCPDIHLKTKEVSEKNNKGTHTTRHCEIIQLNSNTRIIDTPGFSNLKFEFLLPQDVDLLFREIREYNKYCKYPDCLHISESGCHVLKNIKKFHPTRYQSYLEFVEEAKNYKNKIRLEGYKIENKRKFQGSKIAPKISVKKRNSARNTKKQNIYKEIENGKFD